MANRNGPNGRLRTRRGIRRKPLAGIPIPPPVPPLGFGLAPRLRQLRGLILVLPDGLMAEPDTGTIFGRQGLPVGTLCHDGYVRLSEGRYAHRVVWASVHGPIPPGHYIDHTNSVRHDNRIANLQAVTPLRNALLTVERGRHARGSRKAGARLSDDLVAEIRTLAQARTDVSWARELQVNKTTVRHARIGKTWRHVKCRPGQKPPRRKSSKRPRTRT